MQQFRIWMVGTIIVLIWAIQAYSTNNIVSACWFVLCAFSYSWFAIKALANSMKPKNNREIEETYQLYRFDQDWFNHHTSTVEEQESTMLGQYHKINGTKVLN
jgi:hypothetical protein